MSGIKDQFAALYGRDAARTNAIVIDDDDLVGRANVRHLGRLRDETGIRHIAYMDQEAAMEIFISRDVARDALALILSDYDMPELSGIDIARRLREEFNDKLTVFILTSSDTEDETFDKAAEAINAGYVDAFIEKPFDAEKLRIAISAAVSRRIAILKSNGAKNAI